MALDAPLLAAATLSRQSLNAAMPSDDDATFQLQLAHVLLDGGYDGVATIGEVLAGGDHGLGTLDRLNGELVVVDGEPWQIDYTGAAHLVDPSATTPFVIVTWMESPTIRRVRNCSREELAREIESMVSDPDAIVAVRIEGEFHDVLVRSVPPQERPYRPYAEVCLTDEVRWTLAPFDGVFVGFRFPDMSGGGTIPGLHVHGLSADRTTGGHNHDLRVKDVVVSVGVSHEVVVALPDRGMVDLLETPQAMRTVLRSLVRRGPRSAGEVAREFGLTHAEAETRLVWLADRGFVDTLEGGVGGLGGESRWKARLASTVVAPSDPALRPWRASDLLADL